MDRLLEKKAQFPVECTEIAQIVMTTPFDPDQAARRADQFLQSDTVIERNDVILCAVKDIDWTGNIADPEVVSQWISQKPGQDCSGADKDNDKMPMR